MRFERLHPVGFGRFTDFEFQLGHGLNVVYGPNEAGKSTLLSFIEIMLYGAKKDGLSRRHYLPAYDAYVPWSGAPYEGRLEMRLSDGRRIEVFRRFDREREAVTLHDPDLGKDLTGQFSIDNRGEVLFARELLGMTRAVFTGTTYIPQMGLTEGFGDDTNELGSHLVRTLGKSNRDASVSRAQSRLDDALAAIGKTDRGKRSAELKSSIADLEDELLQARTQRADLMAHKERLRELEREHRLVQGMVEQFQSSRARSRITTLQRDVTRLWGLDENIEKEKARVQEYADYRDFPSGSVEDVKSLETERENNTKRIEELKQKVESLEGEMSELQENFKPYKAFRNLKKGADREIVELKTRWMGAEDNVRNVGAQVAGEQDKLRERHKRLEELDGLFSALGPDAGERLERIATEEEQAQEKLNALEQKVDDELQQEKPQRALAAGAALLSFLFAFGGLVADLLETFSVASTRSFWMPMVVVAGAFLVTAILLRLRSRVVSTDVETSSKEYNSLLEHRRGLAKERTTILSLAGVKSVSEFLKLSTEYEVLREEFADNTILLQQKRLPKLEDEAQHLKEQLLALLQHVGLAEEAGLPDESDIQRYINGYQRARELEEAFDSRKERYEEQRADLQKCLDEKAVIERKLADLYRGAETRNFVEFMRKAEYKRNYNDHNAALERCMEKRSDLLGGRGEDDLKAELDKLLAISGDDPEKESGDESSEFDEDEMTRAQERFETVRSEMDTLLGTVEQMEKDQRDPGMIEFELERDRDELARIDRRRNALTTALETLEQATEHLHANVAPLLNSAVGRIAEQITAGRYGGVMIDENLGVSVRAPEDGNIIDVDRLSSGARDQLFFAARIALADALTKKGETVPLILDDSLVEYDYDRAGEAMRILTSVAEERQVVLMTCHQRELALAREICGEKLTLLNLGGAR